MKLFKVTRTNVVTKHNECKAAENASRTQNNKHFGTPVQSCIVNRQKSNRQKHRITVKW